MPVARPRGGQVRRHPRKRRVDDVRRPALDVIAHERGHLRVEEQAHLQRQARIGLPHVGTQRGTQVAAHRSTRTPSNGRDGPEPKQSSVTSARAASPSSRCSTRRRSPRLGGNG